MRILLLTNEFAQGREQARDALGLFGDDVVSFSGRPTPALMSDLGIDWIVSDRNNHIIPIEVLELAEGRAINTHSSLLPFNRGWAPIFFSVWTGTPVGVSIHLVDAGLDTGDIVFQRELGVSPEDTLKSLYLRCRLAVLDGLVSIWPDLRKGETAHRQQIAGGSYHRRIEFEEHFAHLPNGWDSTVAEVRSISSRFQSLQ